ncbi:LCP family protein [Brachybacterium sp. GPGPB12]|uniref:LCP family protein n=1 Tax=Brachybacterium sp. GPGPB12 TaxID=3023517 RepID=UPI0031344102
MHDGRGHGGPAGPGGPPRTRRRRSRIPRPMRLGATLAVSLLVIVLGWGAGLTLWANSRIEHVDALSEAENTPGTTYLIAGSDKRDGEAVNADGTEGARTDTIMLLHKARGGKSYLISLPRDTLVDIPGYGGYKLNAAYSFGGAPLLVETVEEFTGLTIDHYVEIGFDGVSQVVDAVGHVNLCIDQDVDDEKSGLKMTEGRHDVGGEQALAFVRARYFDPTADIGRQARQRQFVSALMDRATSPAVLAEPDHAGASRGRRLRRADHQRRHRHRGRGPDGADRPLRDGLGLAVDPDRGSRVPDQQLRRRDPHRRRGHQGVLRVGGRRHGRARAGGGVSRGRVRERPSRRGAADAPGDVGRFLVMGPCGPGPCPVGRRAQRKSMSMTMFTEFSTAWPFERE